MLNNFKFKLTVRTLLMLLICHKMRLVSSPNQFSSRYIVCLYYCFTSVTLCTRLCSPSLVAKVDRILICLRSRIKIVLLYDGRTTNETEKNCVFLYWNQSIVTFLKIFYCYSSRFSFTILWGRNQGWKTQRYCK